MRCHLTWAGCWWRRCRGRCFSARRRFCGPGASAGRGSAGGKIGELEPRGWCTAAPGSTGRSACCWQTPRRLGRGEKNGESDRGALLLPSCEMWCEAENRCAALLVEDLSAFHDIMHPGHERGGPTCPAALHELEQDINTHRCGQSSPAAAISQLIHWERDKDMKVNEEKKTRRLVWIDDVGDKHCEKWDA